MIVASALIAALSVQPPARGADPGRVTNPGFEADADGDRSPDGWAFIAGEGGQAALSLGKGHGGQHAAKVECGLRQGRWGPGVGQTGAVAVEKGKYYRVSFWAKGEDVVSLTVGLHDTSDWRHCGLWDSVVLMENWLEYEIIFRARKTCSKTTRLQFGIDTEGTLWLDDVTFAPSGPPRNEAMLDVAGATNLVPNASFELGPAGWGTENADQLFGEVDSTTAAQGKHSFRIDLAPDRYPVYYNDFTYRVHGTPTHGPVTSLPLANMGWLPLSKGEAYTLSLWLKSDTPGLTVRAGVQLWPGPHPSTAFAATTQWKRHAFTFKPAQDSGFVTIEAVLDDPTTGRASLWIDGVQLERAQAPSAFETMRPLEIAALAHKPGNIFHVGDDVALDVVVHNSTDAAMRASWQQAVTDFFGQQVQQAIVSADVPAGSTAHRRVVEPPREPGFYRVHVQLQGEHKRDQQMRFAVIFPYARTYPGADSQFGINHAFISDHFMRLAQDAGVSWVRSWYLKWDDVEREKGAFDFAEPDLQLNRLLRLGCRVQVCLATPASRWSSSAPAGLAGNTGSEAELRRNWWLPTSLDDYENYVFRVVEHFRDRVKHWEVFNEPSDRKGGPDTNLDLKTNYIRFLRRARAGATRADPTCRIMGAGHHYASHAMEKQGALDHMDIISEHGYPRLAPSRLWQSRWDGLTATFAAAGGPKPIWLTEYGVYADDDPDPTTARSRFTIRLGKASEREAAKHVVQHYVIALASGVEKAFFHIGNWPWRVNREHGCCFHMFFEYGGAPRKTYVAHNVLAWMLSPQAKFHRRVHAGPSLFAYEFRTDEKSTIVAWRVKRATLSPQARSSLCASRVEVRNVAGRDVRSDLKQLDASPVYFRCDTQYADTLAQTLLELRRQ